MIRSSPCAVPRDRPFVLIGKDRGALRLSDCNRPALALGLTPGMTLADARARIPDLPAFQADPDADRMLLERVAAYCDRFTPLVALDPPHGLTLDITGCAHLFGGEARLMALVGRCMAAAGLDHRTAIAGTPQSAQAMARFGRGGIVPPGGDEAAIRPLPLIALGVQAETVTALTRAGLKTIGDLADRRPETLAARFGEALIVQLRRLLGREDVRITPLRPPPDCVVERHFPDPVTLASALEDAISGLVQEAARILERRGEGGRLFEIAFFRSDGAVRRLAIETGRPSRDAAAILRLWRERADTLADPLDPGFGFDAIKLAVPLCEPLDEVQTSLDRRHAEDHEVLELVDRLVARFGRDRVLRFAARDTHDPRRQAVMVPATARVEPAAPWPEPQVGDPPGRPIQIFEPPQPIETLAEVPDGPPLRFRWRRVVHEIARAEGPERIAPEWWRDGPQPPMRDYYRVEDAQGHRFWVFRAGLYDTGAEPPRWFLHGLFA
ncbi:DNA polymerase Y family protein [Bosea sp. 117]|uniref:Y-family DNA polymerase n=1 Tax=Bosea sp. 117 TaxID=1125973 RepID=UPI000B0098DD|nr:DNA polymerase Y family protein [Bosea sp. 117]